MIEWLVALNEKQARRTEACSYDYYTYRLGTRYNVTNSFLARGWTALALKWRVDKRRSKKRVSRLILVVCSCIHGHLRETHMSRDTRARASTRRRSFSNASVALGTGYRGLSCTKTVQPERRLFPQHLHGPIARVSLCVSLVAAAFLDF